ncbi:MAG: NAD(P)/FAD-dependent oxidoreductase [Thermoplasmatota archaeon]
MFDSVEVDCLIIGAGPVGSVVAKGVAEKGHRVLMIEKRQEIGVPIRCGEGISRGVLVALDLPLEGDWLSSEMEGARIFSPSGHMLMLGPEIAGPEAGFVIKREVFDRMLAQRAARAGAEIRVMTEALSLKREDGMASVRCQQLGKEYDIRSKIVVAADGFESQVARWAGLDPTLSLRDIDTCIQYEMIGIDCDPRYVDFYIGNEVAPGGYVWCFPKGDGTANVGIGINGERMRDPGEAKRYLDRFIGNREGFRKGRIIEINAGGVSVGLPMEVTHGDNIIVVGDAARMIDPITGGGIFNGVKAAMKAVEAVDRALVNGKWDAEGLRYYEEEWRKEMEEELVRNYLVKEKFLDVSDSTLDKIVEAISGYDMKEVSTMELINAITEKYPEVIKDIFG